MTPRERDRLWKDIRESIATAFQAAAQERPRRQEFVDDPVSGLTVPAFVLFERQALCAAVNSWRQSLGCDAITESEIERVECMACGHVDYASKLALYCSEIAMKDLG